MLEKKKQEVEIERQKELKLATKYLEKWRQQKPVIMFLTFFFILNFKADDFFQLFSIVFNLYFILFFIKINIFKFV